MKRLIFLKVKVEPLFEEMVDFDTFSKSDFRAVKVKECVAVPKSKKLLQFTLDDGTGTDKNHFKAVFIAFMSRKNWLERLLSLSQIFHRER